MNYEKDTPLKKGMRRKLYAQIEHAFKAQNVNPAAIAYIGKTSNRTITNIHQNREIAITNLMKIVDILGYEIVLTKKIDVPDVKDNPILVEKINQYNERQKNAQRRKRGQPEGILPTKVRVKRPKVYSRREVTEDFDKQNDIFKFT